LHQFSTNGSIQLAKRIALEKKDCLDAERLKCFYENRSRITEIVGHQSRQSANKPGRMYDWMVVVFPCQSSKEERELIVLTDSVCQESGRRDAIEIMILLLVLYFCMELEER